MAKDTGPAAFLHCSPSPPGGFVRRAPLPPPLTLQSWTCATWLSLDSLHDGTPSAGGAPLFSLFSAAPDGSTAAPAGIAVLVRNGRLVPVAIEHNSHVAADSSSYRLLPRKWHHVAVSVETASVLRHGKTLVTVYLDGQRVDQWGLRVAATPSVGYFAVGAPLALPVADWSAAPLAPLHGQLGAVYLFGTALPVAKVRARIKSLCSCVP